MKQSTTGEWSLSASADLTAAEFEATLTAASADEMFLVPCDEEQAEEAVIRMKAMTNRPMWMDGEDADHYETGLIEALKLYPIDVVQLACVAWRQVPGHGKWWPTEQDLRALCERFYGPRRGLLNKARLLLQDLRIREAEANRANDASYFAGEKHQRFKAEMAKRLLPDQVRAYFNPSHIKYVGADQILVRTLVAEAVLRREGADVLDRLGLTLHFAPEEFRAERDIQREPSPEENEVIAKKMARLTKAMASGECLRTLREAGEI